MVSRYSILHKAKKVKLKGLVTSTIGLKLFVVYKWRAWAFLEEEYVLCTFQARIQSTCRISPSVETSQVLLSRFLQFREWTLWSLYAWLMQCLNIVLICGWPEKYLTFVAQLQPKSSTLATKVLGTVMAWSWWQLTRLRQWQFYVAKYGNPTVIFYLNPYHLY